ncbi:PucR family transcriptional regulator ligand-binding domain-containing protein, partial [Anaerotruncus colihominis]
MSFCCADLFKLKHFKQVRLAAGERGLYRQISWPFICTTPTISQWLHGGELLFISNAGPDTDEADLLALARESFEKALSGMVLLTGGDSIPTVPPALSRLCDEAAFPLFDMPWDIKLVDITQEISEAILYRRAQSKKGQRFIEQLLFSDDDRRSFEELAGFYEVPCRPIRFVTVVDFPPDSLSPTAQERLKSDISHTFKSAGGEGYTALTMG